jgi:hypothetical protein
MRDQPFTTAWLGEALVMIKSLMRIDSASLFQVLKFSKAEVEI